VKRNAPDKSSDVGPGLLPDVQTFLETGQSTAVTDAWFALFAPAGTPQSIISRLAADTQAYTQDADARGRLAELGIEPSPATPEELRATLRDLTEEYRALVRSMPAVQR
jgi:tripartite-type tricarboxylate transporter receptor subunit TctC